MNSFVIANRVAEYSVRPVVMDGEYAVGMFVGEPANMIYALKNGFGRISETDLVSIGNNNWAYTGEVPEKLHRFILLFRDTVAQLVEEALRQYEYELEATNATVQPRLETAV